MIYASNWNGPNKNKVKMESAQNVQYALKFVLIRTTIWLRINRYEDDHDYPPAMYL